MSRRWAASRRSRAPVRRAPTAAAFETLIVGCRERVGSRARWSQRSRTSRRMPPPSEPNTNATRSPRSSAASVCPAASSSPQIQKPASFSWSSARARLTTRTSGTLSSAPEAALASAPVAGGAPCAVDDHRERAEGARRAQNRADVMRIADLVEHYDDAPTRRPTAGRSTSSRSGLSSGSTASASPDAQRPRARTLQSRGGRVRVSARRRRGVALSRWRSRCALLALSGEHGEPAPAPFRIGQRRGDRMTAIDPIFGGGALAGSAGRRRGTAGAVEIGRVGVDMTAAVSFRVVARRPRIGHLYRCSICHARRRPTGPTSRD